MSRVIAIGAIAPHGDIAVPEACDDATRSLAVETQRAMAHMASRIAAASPDAVVIASPHNVHVAENMAVVTTSGLAGVLDEAPVPVPLSSRVDRDLALAAHQAMNAAGVPTVSVSFGGNDPVEAVGPMDWGTLVPLWHLSQALPDLPAVVVAPAREFDAAAHLRAGAAVVRAARGLSKRISFIASADQGHGHSAEGPYGFHPESAVFDSRVVDIVKRGALNELATFDPSDVLAARADSWWQMLMLHGALEEDGGGFAAELLAYEAPTYYGMLTAVFETGP